MEAGASDYEQVRVLVDGERLQLRLVQRDFEDRPLLLRREAAGKVKPDTKVTFEDGAVVVTVATALKRGLDKALLLEKLGADALEACHSKKPQTAVTVHKQAKAKVARQKKPAA